VSQDRREFVLNEAISGIIRISPPVAEVFQFHERPVEFRIVERLAVAGSELLVTFRDDYDSVNPLLRMMRK